MSLRQTETTQQLPLFTYGTLMSNQRAYALLAEAVTASVTARLDGARLHDVGPYPMLVLAAAGSVHGELHWLASAAYAAMLRQLDVYEGETYRRAPCITALSIGAHITAWVYIGATAVAQRYPVVADGRWQGGPPAHA